MKITRSRLIQIAVVIVVISYPIISEVIYYNSISPADKTRFIEFKNLIARESKVQAITTAQGDLLQFRGLLPSRGLLAFPSAAPIYHFDRKGHFIGWIRDPGDMTTPQRFQPIADTRSISIDEAMSLLESKQN